MMRPAQVLDHKGELIERMTDPIVKKAMRAHLTLDQTHVAPFAPKNNDEARATAAALVENGRASLPEAAAYHVSEDLALLVQAAAAQLEELDRIDRSIIPTQAGFVFFEQALPITDIRNKMMRVNWLYWFPVQYKSSRSDTKPKTAVSFMMWNDRYSDPDDIEQDTQQILAGKKDPDPVRDFNHNTGRWELNTEWTAERHREDVRLGLQHFGRWAFIGAELMFDGMRLGPKTVPPNEELRSKLAADGVTPSEFTNSPRYVHALWLLLNQSIVKPTLAEIDRSTRRRAERRAIPPRVTVIQLRRYETHSTPPDEQLIDWQYRWIVRGHWRWQVVGQDHPLAQEILPGKWRARMWIAPYVKGPEDKPLHLQDKVYDLSR